MAPAALAEALPGPELATYALQLLAVMALVDGVLDSEKIAAVAGYAQALGIEEAYLAELTEAAAGHLRWALLDMTRKNIESIFDNPGPKMATAVAMAPPYPDRATIRRWPHGMRRWESSRRAAWARLPGFLQAERLFLPGRGGRGQ